MTTIDSRYLKTVTLDVRNFLKAHPALINDIAGYSLMHMLYSHSRTPKLSRFNRRQLRQLRNRRRRWFVDNVVMHHKRMHDQDRDLVVNKAKERLKMRKKYVKDKSKVVRYIEYSKKEQGNSWSQSVLMKERGGEIRGRIQTRKIRARTRWASIVGS